MFNFMKQLEGKHYIDCANSEWVIDEVEIDENNDFIFWIECVTGDEENVRFYFNELWDDFKEWA